VTSIEGRLLRSYRSVLVAPGTLTAIHVRGQRRRYLGPLALFFVANAVFAALQSYLGLAILSSPLESHLNHQDWSAPARVLVERHLQASGQTLTEYAVVFDQAAIFNSKVLMILMALAFTAIPLLLFPRPRRPAGAHAVFALHVYVFVLTLLCVSMLLSAAELASGGGGLASRAVDLALSVFNLGACAVYIYIAIAAAYGSRGWARVLKAAALAVSVAALFIAYRFGIFIITLYTT